MCTASVLQVRVYDKDIIKSDDDLGLARLPLATLQPSKPTEMSLDLKGVWKCLLGHTLESTPAHF